MYNIVTRNGRYPLRILHPVTNQTVDKSTELVGIAPPGSLVYLVFDKAEKYIVSADKRGHWRYTPRKRLNAGLHSVNASLSGYEGTPGSAYVTYNVRDIHE